MSHIKKRQVTDKSASERRAEKKAIVLKTTKWKQRLPWALVVVVCAVMIGAGVLLTLRGMEETTIAAKPSGAEVSATTVSYPVDLFADGKARHFSYHVDDTMTIRYFILKSSDGVIRAAFDACDVCWPAGKGYVQSGDVMICRNCGRKFASVQVNEVQGGCNPAPLKRQIEGEKVVLKIQDILAGKKYFDFTKRG